MTGTAYGIVAGYDGSPGAAQALRWAAREAWARGTTLMVCLASGRPRGRLSSLAGRPLDRPQGARAAGGGPESVV
jgi:hypothetical protein